MENKVKIKDIKKYEDNSGGRALVETYGCEYALQWDETKKLTISATSPHNTLPWQRKANIKNINDWFNTNIAA